jgi:hypothetical protein
VSGPTCTALVKDTRELRSLLDLVELWKSPQCLAPAVWQTPFGPRCDKHTHVLEEAMRSGKTVFALLHAVLYPHSALPNGLVKTKPGVAVPPQDPQDA